MIVEMLMREGPTHIPGSRLISEDLAIIVRYSLGIYNLLCYLNADERRESDPYWREHLGVTAMSLVRGLIDCLRLPIQHYTHSSGP